VAPLNKNYMNYRLDWDSPWPHREVWPGRLTRISEGRSCYFFL
jgi:hypothetical protein